MSHDITLVHPLFMNKDPVEARIMTPYFPLGLMYLGAGLRKRGYEVRMFDCAFRHDFDEFDAYMQRERPRVVGITSLITIRRNALILAEIAKGYGATVVLGGPDPTGVPERYLYHQSSDGSHPVDIVAFDEADHTILDLVDHLFECDGAIDDVREIVGLRLRDGEGRVFATPARPLIQDMDSIPFPARDMVDLDPYRDAWIKKHGYWSLSLINTRGCPYGCAWCQKAVFGRTYRSRSAENSAEEMRLIKEQYTPDQLRIVDDITGVNRRWIVEWRDAVLAHDAAIPFECLTRVNLVTDEMLGALKDIGCTKVYLGAESGSQRVLDAMNKGAKVGQIYKAARRCKAFGIDMYYFMMVGYPTEEWEDLKQSVKLLTTTLPEEFSTTIAYPLPGTPFYAQMRDRLMFNADWQLDWEYTSQNKLLFQRERYNTLFYQLVIRWFQKEWEFAWMKAGKQMSMQARIKRIKIIMGLWVYRLLARTLAAVPGPSAVRFQPAEGR